MQHKERKYAVVFGMGPAGLFLSRQLKRCGHDVLAIGKADDIGRYSNILEQYWTATDKASVAEAISEITSRHGRKLQAWICSDQYLTLFIEEYPDAFSLLEFKNPDEKTLRLIADKSALMAYCREIGIRFPERYTIEKENIGDIDYPVALKPNVKHGTSPIKKINFANNETELRGLLAFAQSHQLEANQLIVQKRIVGDNSTEYGYGGYFVEGKTINDVYFLQARQYPQGVCCYTIELADEGLKTEITEQVQKFIAALSYTGFLQFDLKKDRTTGQIYVLDINPRPWGSVGMLLLKCKAKGVFEHNAELPTKVCWRFPLKELLAFGNKNNVAYAECERYKKDGRYKTIIDLWDWHDMKPFLMQPVITLMKLTKRV